jgi:hypothetical protein
MSGLSSCNGTLYSKNKSVKTCNVVDSQNAEHKKARHDWLHTAWNTEFRLYDSIYIKLKNKGLGHGSKW